MEERVRDLYEQCVDACRLCTKQECEDCVLNMVIEALACIIDESRKKKDKLFGKKEITNHSHKFMRKPLDQKYISVNFETIGKCPRCGKEVVDSIGHREKICGGCELELYWD